VDNVIDRINHYPAGNVVCFVNIYPLNSDLSIALSSLRTTGAWRKRISPENSKQFIIVQRGEDEDGWEKIFERF